MFVVAKTKIFVLLSVVTCISSIAADRILLCADYGDNNCVSMTYDVGECVNLPREMLGALSSVKHELDPNEHYCTLYEKADCAGASFQVDRSNPALTRFNDRTTSFKCTS